MQYVRLGNTGLEVSRICLGCMSYGDPGWRPWVLDETAARPHFARALERGVNFFDTADMYSNGRSEEVTGKVLREIAPRDDYVLASKVYFPVAKGPNRRGLSRKHMLAACDASLRRLGLDWIDLYQIHRSLNGAPGSTDGTTTAPADLLLFSEGPLGMASVTRQVSLNEEESSQVCVPFDEEADEYELDDKGRLRQIRRVRPGPDFHEDCEEAGGAPFGPIEALLGTVVGSGETATGVALKWTDTTGTSDPVTVYKVDGTPVTINVTENPTVGGIEDWEIYNFTADAHPIHLHLVRFQVIERRLLDGSPSPNGSPQPWETGFKDTVLAFPGEITTIRAKFDLEGLYVWHCHIVEHEDNEMMRPFVVSAPPAGESTRPSPSRREGLSESRRR